MNKLTKKQKKMLSMLKKTINIDRSITYKELAEQMNLPSTGSLSAYIKVLEQKGYLKRLGQYRGLGNNIRFLNRKDRAEKEKTIAEKPIKKEVVNEFEEIRKEFKDKANKIKPIKKEVMNKIKTPLVKAVKNFNYEQNLSLIIISLGVAIHLVLSGLALLK